MLQKDFGQNLRYPDEPRPWYKPLLHRESEREGHIKPKSEIKVRHENSNKRGIKRISLPQLLITAVILSAQY